MLKRLFLYALAFAASAFGQHTPTLYGRIQIFDSHELGRLETLLMEDASGILLSEIPISLRNLRRDIATGDRVKLRVKANNSTRRSRNLQSLVMNEFDVEESEILETSGGKDFVVDGKPVELSSGTVLFSSICNTTLQYDEAHVRNSWFGGAVGSLENMFDKCTFNQLLWKRDRNIVTTMPTVPCTGRRKNAHNDDMYDFNFETRCGWEELIAWREFAREHLISIGVDVTKTKRLVIVMPERKACGFSGLGYVGCPPNDLCTVWLQGYDRIDNHIVIHELLHNTGLMHSNRYASTGENLEYGDPTDPLGFGRPPSDPINSFVCPNAPQAYKAGWMSPSTQLDASSINNFVTVTIPAYGSQRNAFVRITQGPPANDIQPALYFSYRVRTPQFDSGLDEQLESRIYIHDYNGTTLQPRPDPWGVAPHLVAIMDMPNRKPHTFFTWQSVENWMTVLSRNRYQEWRFNMVDKTDAAATVYVCKYMGAEDSFETCIDGYDNDCDGLADLDSSLCQFIFGITPMPPPLAPPSPPSPSPPPFPSPPHPPSPTPPRPPRPSPPPPKATRPVKKAKGGKAPPSPRGKSTLPPSRRPPPRPNVSV